MKAADKIKTVFLNNGFELHDLKSAVQERPSTLDLAIAVGGDGTFLRAAGWIRDSVVPLIGFNSDPESSQGELCTIGPDQTQAKLENKKMALKIGAEIGLKMSLKLLS